MEFVADFHPHFKYAISSIITELLLAPFSPQESKKRGNICPQYSGTLTLGTVCWTGDGISKI